MFHRGRRKKRKLFFLTRLKYSTDRLLFNISCMQWSGITERDNIIVLSQAKQSAEKQSTKLPNSPKSWAPIGHELYMESNYFSIDTCTECQRPLDVSYIYIHLCN